MSTRDTTAQAILDIQTVFQIVGLNAPHANMRHRMATSMMENVQFYGIGAALKQLGWTQESVPYATTYTRGEVEVVIVNEFDGVFSQFMIKGW